VCPKGQQGLRFWGKGILRMYKRLLMPSRDRERLKYASGFRIGAFSNLLVQAQTDVTGPIICYLVEYESSRELDSSYRFGAGSRDQDRIGQAKPHLSGSPAG